MKRFLMLATSVALLGGVLLVAPNTAVAASAPTYDWYVSQDYRTLDFGNGRSCSYADDDSIQDVLDAVADNETVFICAGTWTGDALWVDDAITIIGAGKTRTYLDGGYGAGCNGTGDSILYTNGEDLTVRNIAFQNGCADDNSGWDGGAINIGSGTFTCLDSDFADNAADDWGGAVVADYVNLNRCSFEDNYAAAGGAVFAMDSIWMLNSTFVSNDAYYAGGALWVDDNYTVKASTFIDNQAYEDDGGAIWADGDYSGAISNSRFVGNDADESGGAISHLGTAYLWVSGSTFTSNTVCYLFSSCVYGWGGAIYSEGDLTVDRSTFTSNISGGGGGAAIAMYATSDPDLTLNNVVFKSNSGYTIVEECGDGGFYTKRVRYIANSYTDLVGCN